MRKIYLPLILDTVFIIAVCFLTAYTLLLLFLSKTLSAVCALLFALMLGYIFGYIYYRKLKKDYLSKVDEKLCADALFTLALMNKTDVNRFMKKLLNASCVQTEMKNGCLYSAKEDAYYITNFTLEPCSVDDVRKLTIDKMNRNCIVYLTSAKEGVEKFFHQHGVTIIANKQFFAVMKTLNIFPSPLLEQKRKLTVNMLALNLLKKENFKRYVFFGLFFLAFSFITPFKTYYVIAGSVFILLAVACKFERFFATD